MVRALSGLMTLIFVIGCSRSGIDRLTAETGVSWRVEIDPRFHAVSQLEPKQLPAAILGPSDSPASAASAFLQSHGDVFGIHDAKSELRLTVSGGPDARGLSYATFAQSEHGVPVYGGRLSVQLRNGSVALVSGLFLPNLHSFSVEPSLTADNAATLAQTDLPLRYPDAATGQPDEPPPPAPQLVIWPMPDQPVLAYSLLVSFALPDKSRVAARYVIDARTGRIIDTHRAEQALATGAQIDGSGLNLYYTRRHFPVVATTPPDKPPYFMQQLASPSQGGAIYVSEPNALSILGVSPDSLASQDNNSWDTGSVDRGSAVDAYFNVLEAQKWWANRGMTHGYDDNDGVLQIIVHEKGMGCATS
jgi:hypothetical protein